MESRNASFFEHVFPYRSKDGASLSKRAHKTMTRNSWNQEQKDEVDVELRRSKKAMTKKILWSRFSDLYARK